MNFYTLTLLKAAVWAAIILPTLAYVWVLRFFSPEGAPVDLGAVAGGYVGALVLGEFTMASLDLWTTLPVWIYQFQQTDGHIATAVSMFSLIGTWVLLTVIVSVDRSQSRRSRRRTGTL